MAQKLFELFFEKRITKLPQAKKHGNIYSIGAPITLSSFKKVVIKKQFDRLTSAFNLSNDSQSFDRFKMATSGVEWKEINQLNSSALLAFLCFYKINNDNKITIPGIGEFNNVYFEIKSPLKIHAKSNMDVVLTNDDTVLFLESKFTEYLSPTKTYKSRIAYEDYYMEIFDGNPSIGDISIATLNGECLWSCSTGSRAYFEGLKQLISHTLGICNTLTQPRPKSWEVAEGNLGTKKHFILAEILFKFKEDAESKDPLKSYANYYAHLQDKLNVYIKNQKLAYDVDFTVHKTLLTYQHIFNENMKLLDEAVANFYFDPNGRLS